MPAKIKVYYDRNCTQELARDQKTNAFLYTFFKQKEDGTIQEAVDGIRGEAGRCILYLKNVGTRAALHPQITFISTNNQEIINKKVYTCKDIAVDQVEELQVDFTIKAWTAAQISENYVSLEYYSLPDTVSYTNPYNYYAEIGEETNTYVTIDGV